MPNDTVGVVSCVAIGYCLFFCLCALILKTDVAHSKCLPAQKRAQPPAQFIDILPCLPAPLAPLAPLARLAPLALLARLAPLAPLARLAHLARLARLAPLLPLIPLLCA